MNLAKRGIVITSHQACEGWENTRVTYFPKEYENNKRGFTFYTALGDNLNKRKAKLVTLFYGIWYIITYNLKSDCFIIINPWLNLHKHNKYSALLDGPRWEQEQLDEGLVESQGQPPAHKNQTNHESCSQYWATRRKNRRKVQRKKRSTETFG